MIPNIPNAYENIVTTCGKKLAELYPVQAPDEITSRYQQELLYLKESEYLNDFEIFRRLSEKVQKFSTVVTAQYTVAGSFLYYLLGNHCFNPLPAHYCCPHCGYYEKVNAHIFGLDMPSKKCPICGNLVVADGFNLEVESVWGITGDKPESFVYNVATEFLPTIRKLLEEIFPKNVVIPIGLYPYESEDVTKNSKTKIHSLEFGGYAILPYGMKAENYPEFLSYFDDKTVCLACDDSYDLLQQSIKIVNLRCDELIDKLMVLQHTSGVRISDISLDTLHGVNWHESVSKEAMIHNSLAKHVPLNEYETHYKKMQNTNAFQMFTCYTREDFYDYLLEARIEKEMAFKISEKIRKGYGCLSVHLDYFESLPIPEGIKEVARNYSYVVPRAQCIEQVRLLWMSEFYKQISEA